MVHLRKGFVEHFVECTEYWNTTLRTHSDQGRWSSCYLQNQVNQIRLEEDVHGTITTIYTFVHSGEHDLLARTETDYFQF
jgi:hypothetical protein